MACTEDEFKEVLAAEVFVDLLKLREMARYGIPDRIRGEVWSYLLGVTKPIKSQVEAQVSRSYQHYLSLHESDKERSFVSPDLLRTIRSTVDRYCSVAATDKYFREPDTRKALENILSAYVNTSADVEFSAEMLRVLAPILFAVRKEEQAFRCFEALVSRTNAYIPLERIPHRVGQLMMLLRTLNPQLSSHLEEEGIQPNDWARSWLQSLLSHALPLQAVLRLWDSYFSSPEGLQLHIFVCLAILSHLSEELTTLADAELRYRLQHLPLMDMDLIIAEAYNIREETSTNS